MSGENDQIEQVRKRVYAALSVAISGTGDRLLCQPFNPGQPEKVQVLATRVLGLVLNHLLEKLSAHEVEQLIAKINAQVVSQGTNNAGQVVLDRLLGAAFPIKSSPEKGSPVASGTGDQGRS